MKNYLTSEVEGKGFFKTYILFLIPMLILAIFSNSTDKTLPLLSSLSSIIESYVYMLLGFAVFRYVIQFVKFKDKPFGFSGSMKEIAPKILKWYLLTIITVGIYSPWMIRNLADYYLKHVNQEERSGEFLSRPGRLLKYMLLTLYLPLAVLMTMFIIFLFRSTAFDMDYNPAVIAGPTFAFVIVVFLITIPFMYFYFVWIVNARFGEHRVEFRKSMAEFAGFLIPQLLLSIITLFIYYPAAVIRIYRYMLAGSVYLDGTDTEKGGFGFDGAIGRGFGLLWGQGLLTLITIGIYGPWAIAKVANWYINNTFIESTE